MLSYSDMLNAGTWVLKIGPITQGPIIGTEHTRTRVGSPSLIYGRGFTMAIISNNIRDMLVILFMSNIESPRRASGTRFLTYKKGRVLKSWFWR